MPVHAQHVLKWGQQCCVPMPGCSGASSHGLGPNWDKFGSLTRITPLHCHAGSFTLVDVDPTSLASPAALEPLAKELAQREQRRQRRQAHERAKSEAEAAAAAAADAAARPPNAAQLHVCPAWSCAAHWLSCCGSGHEQPVDAQPLADAAIQIGTFCTPAMPHGSQWI